MERGLFVPRRSRCPDSIWRDRGMIRTDPDGSDKLKDAAVKGRHNLYISVFSSSLLLCFPSFLQQSQCAALAITDESSKPLEQPTSDQSFD